MKRLFCALTLITFFAVSPGKREGSTQHEQHDMSIAEIEKTLNRIANKIDRNTKLGKKDRQSLLTILDALSAEQQTTDELLEAARQLIVNGITNKTLDKKAFIRELKKSTHHTPFHDAVPFMKTADEILSELSSQLEEIHRKVTAQEPLSTVDQLNLVNALNADTFFLPPLPQLTEKNQKKVAKLNKTVFKILGKGLKNASIRKDDFLEIVDQAHGLNDEVRGEIVEYVKNQKEM